MYTAEKRAALEAAGEPWPNCECHGEPMLWGRNPKRATGGHFRCQVKTAAWKRRFRADRNANGVCTHCGGPLATETLCRSCADAHADLMAQPEQYLEHLFAGARYRSRARADEGFQSTGAGIAALAARNQPGS